VRFAEAVLTARGPNGASAPPARKTRTRSTD
jgi:hypothetical protein